MWSCQVSRPRYSKLARVGYQRVLESSWNHLQNLKQKPTSPSWHFFCENTFFKYSTSEREKIVWRKNLLYEEAQQSQCCRWVITSPWTLCWHRMEIVRFWEKDRHNRAFGMRKGVSARFKLNWLPGIQGFLSTNINMYLAYSDVQ